MVQAVVSQADVDYLAEIRASVVRLMKKASHLTAQGGKLLDVAPQIHEGARPYFPQAEISTLDIDPRSGATFIADLCENNSSIIPSSSFDYVVCTEVLEHTLNPFEAVKELGRILRQGGLLFASAPFNFRIHGPLPDCWRFSEYGWRALMTSAAFEIVELDEVKTQGRDLMPIHYTVIARKT